MPDLAEILRVLKTLPPWLALAIVGAVVVLGVAYAIVRYHRDGSSEEPVIETTALTTQGAVEQFQAEVVPVLQDIGRRMDRLEDRIELILKK